MTKSLAPINILVIIGNSVSNVSNISTNVGITKARIATKLAKILGIHKFAISKLSVDSELETLHTLFKIDMVYGLNWNKNGDTVSLSFPDDCTTINRYLKKVYEARQALIKGEITYEDYVYIQNACGTYKKKEG